MLTTGEILKRERHHAKLTLEEVERATRIRKKNLEAIEKNDWKQFPSKTYILGVIKSYGKFLGLDEEKLSAFFRREYGKKDDLRFKRKINKHFLVPQTKKVFRLAILFIITIFIFYFGYQLKLYLSPPRLIILSPTKTIFKRESRFDLIGQTEKETIITVNGERVYLDSQNKFRITLPLTKEKNEVTIEATGANGKKTTVKKVFEKK